MDTLDNLASHMTFTGSLDESWFYLVSVAIEARGGPLVPMMIDAIAAARCNDSNTVIQALRLFAERLDELGTLLERMYESCDPHVFYHRIRPFLAGSKNMADAGLPQGVVFDDGTGRQPHVQFSGGSNAQSSIIQFFDIVLGIEHRPTGERHTAPPEPGAVQAPSHGFIQDMRRYMPGPHRRFLEHTEQVANIRDYVTSNRSNRALTTAYDACLAMLRALRDKHIQLVSRYIIIKSRESRSHSRSLSPQTAKSTRVNLANTLARDGSGNKKLRGTGGTALIPFLKQARDETGEPAIDAWARRLLNNGPGGDEGVGKGGKGGGEVEIVGLAGTWSVDDSEGGVSKTDDVMVGCMCANVLCRSVIGKDDDGGCCCTIHDGAVMPGTELGLDRKSIGWLICTYSIIHPMLSQLIPTTQKPGPTNHLSPSHFLSHSFSSSPLASSTTPFSPPPSYSTSPTPPPYSSPSPYA